MTDSYAFLRPLLAANRAWVAIDWQNSALESIDSDSLTQLFNEAGAGALADKIPFVLPASPEWLGKTGLIQKFTAKQVIFALPSSTLETPEAIRQCILLRQEGYHFALRTDNAEIIKQIPVAAFDYLQIDAGFARHQLRALDLSYTSDAGFRRIATGVDAHELFDWLAARNFEVFDSRFVTVLDPFADKKPDLTRLKLLKLLSLVAQDADTREIEEIFREEPKLSYNLLRLVNSVAVGAKTTIGSFQQAIAILGRRQLQRWLQLLIYADQLAKSSEPNPLMQLAAARGRQMELLIAAIEPAIKPSQDLPEPADTAFMTGIFSLLDVLLNMPMAEILEALPFQAAIRDALDAKRGLLGQLLNAIIAGETGEFTAAATILAAHGISPARHAKAQAAALLWASKINLD